MVGVLLFPIHQDIIISTIPLESMKVLVRVSNHRVAPDNVRKLLSRKNVSFNSFLIGFCLRSGKTPLSFLSSGMVMNNCYALDYENSIGLTFPYLVRSIFWASIFGAWQKPLGLLLWSLYFWCGIFYSYLLCRRDKWVEGFEQ
jgi:hypothetical protein